MPAGPTYEKIQSNTLASTASSVSFASIPATYTDLAIVLSGKSNSTSYLRIELNGQPSSSNYSNIIFGGDGSTVDVVRQVGAPQTSVVGTFMSDGTFNTIEINILNYSSATGTKSILAKDDSSIRTRIIAAGYNLAIAITDLTFYIPDGSPFQVGSTFSLYGIKAA